MKKNILFGFCLIVIMIPQIIFAQNLLWSKKIQQPKICASKGIITDVNGIVYSYGSLGLDPNQNGTMPSLTDTAGSFLQSYSTNGNLINNKRWAIPFYIQNMVYDGNQFFYFSATFVGTQIIDGITIVSQGNTDGVTGKMDLSGNIIWMKTFGGSGVDRGNGICFNSTDNSIYATGNIRDTLFLNNVYESINQQSAIILNYSATGNLINYKLYDFVANRDLGFINSGREICNDGSGNFFLMMDRDGKTPDDISSGPDSVTGAIMGRYILKLNSNLDTLWSTYIIGPASYYGWSGNSLRVAANGDVYIAWESSGHYGGDAYLSRLNGSTGAITWSYHNQDGYYSDLFIDVNTVFLIGNEGAIGCPCPMQNEGYYIVKKFDESNTLLGETRFSGVDLNNITKDQSGNLFVVGDLWHKTATVGTDLIQADSIYDSGSYYYFARFLTKLSDINCVPLIISVSVPSSYGHYYPLCYGDQATLTENLSQGTFLWSNGTSGTQTQVDSTGLYTVKNVQPNGCTAYSVPVDIEVNPPIDKTVTQSGQTLTANLSNVYYQWFDCFNNTIIAGDTNQSYTASASGSYAVIIRLANNCSDTSVCTNVTITGIPDNTEPAGLYVYQDPMNNIVYVNYKNNETKGIFKLEIKNILGQTIYASAVPSFQGEYKQAIDLSKEPSGNYFIQVITENKTITRKILSIK